MNQKENKQPGGVTKLYERISKKYGEAKSHSKLNSTESNSTSKGESLTDETVWQYFKNKLEKLPVKNIESVEKPLKYWWNWVTDIVVVDEDTRKNPTVFDPTSKSSRPGKPRKGRGTLAGYFLGGKMDHRSSQGKSFVYRPNPKRPHKDSDFMNIDFDKWISMGNENEYLKFGKKYVDKCKAIFAPMKGPDCVKAYADGYEAACNIRKQEGYIINNTLAQMTKDIKRISKIAIKEKIEASKDFPCLYEYNR